MKKENRILGYSKAKIISTNELKQISAGAAKWSCEHTLKGSGGYPGVVDVEADQIWD